MPISSGGNKNLLLTDAGLVEWLPEDERKLFRAAFDELDTNGNGTIDKQELGAFLSIKWRHVIPKKTVESIVKLADADGDGKIGFEEFVALQLKYMPSCFGYCKNCENVIVGQEGYACPKCASLKSTGFVTDRRSFTLCKACYEKEERPEHPHDYKLFQRIKTGTSRRMKAVQGNLLRGFSHLEEELKTGLYGKYILRPMLELQYKGDGGAYWSSAVECFLQ